MTLFEEAKASVALDGETQTIEGPTRRTPDSIAIVSGGLDSTTLVYDMISHGYTPHMLSFDYGQRHRKELLFARHTAEKLGLRHDIIDMTGITHLISNSALTSPRREFVDTGKPTEAVIDVPEGHYAEESMKATVVPNRNMIMLAIACGIAVNYKYKTIGVGVHGGDHFIYPDCRPEFIFSIGQAMLQGNEGFHNFFTDEEISPELAEMGYSRSAKPLTTPYLNKTKADIAFRALELGVPLEETWSCYKGGEIHCGKCGTCVERLEAINEAIGRLHSDPNNYRIVQQYTPGTDFDKTQYEDSTFWLTAKAN